MTCCLTVINNVQESNRKYLNSNTTPDIITTVSGYFPHHTASVTSALYGILVLRDRGWVCVNDFCPEMLQQLRAGWNLVLNIQQRIKVKDDARLFIKPISELRSVTCHMGSDSVPATWHRWTRPALTPAR